MDPRLLPLMLLLISNIHLGQTKDKPKVSVKPQSSVFTGDTVTLSCDVRQSTGRKIIWYKNSEIIETGDQTKTLRDVRVSDGGQYTCGVAGGETTQSKPVMLTVRERPKPALHVQPDEHVFRGQMVNLTCDIQETDVSSWSYIWSKDDSEIDVSQSQEYRISSVDESHTGRYSCTGRETGGSRSSHTSDTVTLTLSDPSKVSVKPQSSVFTGDTVTLSCDVGQPTGRTIIWWKNSKIIETGDQTKTLINVNVSDGGQYTCAVVKDSSIQNKSVMLTVRERPKPVLRVDPDEHVFRGQTVNLTCDIQETDVSSWSYIWSKDDSEIDVSQSQEYRISSVNESHTGRYSCTGRETGGSRSSHTSDTVTLTLSESPVPLEPTSSGVLMIGVISGLSGAFLLILLLVLQFCCRRNKGEGSPSPSTDHQLQNIRQTAEHQRNNGQTPASSNAVTGPPSVTYMNVGLKSLEEMRKKNKGEQSSDTIYSKLMF
ncbi:kin of IRRE-like protein 3 [Carassius gibelio]|uniref:kin of IRRE-like protein 3 n=1 Tax=Carassius gibelio TaxID=101364 RepID=UPI0022773F5B|nr:kin of IRRE-like protein 3 [Carassius gibelio]